MDFVLNSRVDLSLFLSALPVFCIFFVFINAELLVYRLNRLNYERRTIFKLKLSICLCKLQP